MKEKKCAKCKEVKDVDDFYKKAPLEEEFEFQASDFTSYCKECTIAVTRASKKARKNYKGYVPNDVRKAQLFAFWQSIPSMVRGNKYLEKAKGRAVKGLEDEDEIIEKLVEAGSLGEVSDILDVSKSTLGKYRESEYVKAYTDKFNKWSNVQRFKSDVDHAFTKATIKHADSSRVKLWYQIYQDWVPEERKTHDFEESTMRDIQSEIRKIGEKHNIVEGEDAEEGEIVEDKMIESHE